MYVDRYIGKDTTAEVRRWKTNFRNAVNQSHSILPVELTGEQKTGRQAVRIYKLLDKPDERKQEWSKYIPIGGILYKGCCSTTNI